MKKIVVLISLALVSCKSTKTQCDAYGEVEYDIHKSNAESQKKYTTTTSIK